MSKNFCISTTEAQVVSAVKDTMNISAAASFLGIPKTTLSSILAKVEKKLQNTIFIRKQGSGEVKITEFGNEVIPKLEKIIWITESFRPTKETSKKVYNAGKINIISTQTFLESFIAPYLKEFIDENPEIRISLHQKDSDYYYQPKSNDIFIGCWEYNTENYHYIPYHDFCQKLWASKSYLETHGNIDNIDELLKHRLLIVQTSMSQEHYSGNDFIVRRLGMPLSSQNIIYVRTGLRLVDVLAERGVGIIAASEETTLLNKLKVEPILSDIHGEYVSFYVKVEKKFIETPLARYVVDWIFSCRDKALRSIEKEPKANYEPFRPEKD
jgi:DNA-binding transcriptional LysR family regulator